MTIDDDKAEPGSCFDAAVIVNQGEISEAPEKNVIADFQGKSCVISPSRYKKPAYYLRSQAASALFRNVNREKSLHIQICGQSNPYAQFEPDEDQAPVFFESVGKQYTMIVTANRLKSAVSGLLGSR